MQESQIQILGAVSLEEMSAAANVANNNRIVCVFPRLCIVNLLLKGSHLVLWRQHIDTIRPVRRGVFMLIRIAICDAIWASCESNVKLIRNFVNQK